MKILKWLGVLLVFYAIGKLASPGSEPITAAQLAAEASKRASFPVDLGDGFRLDSITASGNAVVSNVTLLDMPLAPADPQLRSALQAATVSDVCREIASAKAAYIRANIRLTKRYLDKAGSELVSVTVDPVTC